MQRALGVGDSEDLEEHELLEAIARRGGTLVVLRVWGSSVSAPLLAVCRRDGTLVSASKNGPRRMTATSLSDELKSDAEAVAVFEAASDSLYLPLSPCISLSFLSPSISLYLPLPQAARRVKRAKAEADLQVRDRTRSREIARDRTRSHRGRGQSSPHPINATERAC